MLLVMKSDNFSSKRVALVVALACGAAVLILLGGRLLCALTFPPLPNGYRLVTINGETFVFSPDPNAISRGGIDGVAVDGDVVGVAVVSQHMIVKRVNMSLHRRNQGKPKYFIIDTITNVIDGPLDESQISNLLGVRFDSLRFKEPC